MRRIACTSAWLVTVLGSACAARSGDAQVIHVRDLPERPTYRVEWITDDRTALAVAMAVMEQELRLPRLDVTFHFFPDGTAFEAALRTQGYDAALAQQTASRMGAVGGYRRVLLNSATLARVDGASKAALFAHELTHSLQYELGGGIRGTSAQWLREGFADWVAARVLDALDVEAYEALRARRAAEYRRRAEGGGPSLGRMQTFPEWVALSAGPDAPAMAAKAFLAADFLIERKGGSAVIDYFRRFAGSTDAGATFADTFGETPADFERALDRRLR